MHTSVDGGAAAATSQKVPGTSTNCYGYRETNKCPNWGAATRTVSTHDLSSGAHQIYGWSIDVAGNGSNPFINPVPVRVDKTNPDLPALSGPLSPGSMQGGNTLTVQGTDAHSGVRSISLTIDGQPADPGDVQGGSPADCPNVNAGGCSRTLTFAPNPDSPYYGAGNHTLTATVTDQLGRTSTTSWSNDWIDPTMSLSGALVNQEGETLQGPTTLSIGGTDTGAGQTGIAKYAVVVDGSPVVQQNLTCTPSSCPGTLDTSYSFDPAAVSAGEHTLAVKVFDRADNQTDKTIQVITGAPPSGPTCSSVTSTTQSTGTQVTAAGAVSAVHAALVEPSALGAVDKAGVPLAPSVDDSGNDLIATGTLSEGQLIKPANSGAKVIGDGVCLMPLQTTADETAPVVANDDSVVIANTATDTDTFVRPTVSGQMITLSEHGPNAPSSFEYELDVPQGAELEELNDGANAGGIAVVDPTTEVLATSTEDGVTTTMVVPPAPANGPNVADLNDTEAQLARNEHAVAAAEIETGHEVVAVIPAALSVSGSGATQSVDVEVRGGGKAIKITPPVPAEQLVFEMVRPDARCASHNGLNTFTNGVPFYEAIYHEQCIWDTSLGANAIWKTLPGSISHRTPVRLQNRLFVGEGTHLVARSNEVFHPVWTQQQPLILDANYGRWAGRQQWCGRLHQHTDSTPGVVRWRGLSRFVCLRFYARGRG